MNFDVSLTSLEIALALIFAALAALAAYLWGRHAKGEGGTDPALTEKLDRLAEAQSELRGAVQSVGATSENSRASLEKSLNERLDAVTKRVGDSISQTTEKTGQSLRMLHERLALIDGAQKSIQELAGEVTSLQALLSNKQSRGAFGEIQMQDIVRDFLPASAFEFQHTLSNGSRVDCLIRLPNPPGSIAVDSKFPLEASRAYQDAGDEAAKTSAARALKTAMTTHIRAISEKYAIPGETADVTLMFLPSERVYATLHAEFQDIIDASFKAKVMIVSPTTFMATLNTMRAVMKDARMREAAGQIQKEVGKLGEDVGRLDDRVGKLQRHFGQAEEDIRQIRISTDKVSKRAERIEEVQLEDIDPDAIAAPAAKSLPED